ncbi:MAG: DUF357 domain-containing protein [Candidatus Nanoarchaeia archaeon]|jgi:hypothetical protein|nr:DUF357 domain-containing protein [Candidatus Nanoarchaeia archaeon]|tara:strand:+ start:51841 stop:52128 length:288 start_codon:yes stop_codon:yes gene_type:complete
MDKITSEKLNKYFNITKKALEQAKNNKGSFSVNEDEAYDDFIDMITRYVEDAKHFQEKNDIVTAFAALNYAHGWLDAGARLGLFNVNDNSLFTVD